MRRPLCLALVAVAVSISPAAAQPKGERIVNIYNWTDYIDPSVLADFTKETGIKTRYDVYDSLEILETKISAGHSGYDIIAPSNEPAFSRLIRAGALATIDRERVTAAAAVPAVAPSRVPRTMKTRTCRPHGQRD